MNILYLSIFVSSFCQNCFILLWMLNCWFISISSSNLQIQTSSQNSYVNELMLYSYITDSWWLYALRHICSLLWLANITLYSNITCNCIHSSKGKGSFLQDLLLFCNLSLCSIKYQNNRLMEMVVNVSKNATIFWGCR